MVVLCLVLVVLVSQFDNTSKEEDLNNTKAIFSWHKEEVTSNHLELIETLKSNDFTTVFQNFSSELSTKTIVEYAYDLSNNGLTVYGLAGTPEWAQDAEGLGMINQLERISLANKQLSEKRQIKGIVMDVEPYLLDDFEWTDEGLKRSFKSGLKALFDETKLRDLELIVVIPYFYDTKGYGDVLKYIIESASDAVAVMNYYRDEEINHIAEEASIAEQVQRPIFSIYELKAPGQYDLTNLNTYHNQGLEAIEENFLKMKARYSEQEVWHAYHDYRALKEVLKRE